MFTNTAAAIDFMAVRYGADTVSARTLMLNWLKAATNELWMLDDWWWKTEEVALTLPAESNSLLLDADYENIVGLRTDTGMPIEMLIPTLFNQLCRVTSSGTPALYTVGDLDPTSGQIILRWFPTDTSDLAAVAVKRVRDVVLADDANNRTKIPYEWTHIPVYRALSLLCTFETRPDESAIHQSTYEGLVSALRAENARRKGVK